MTKPEIINVTTKPKIIHVTYEQYNSFLVNFPHDLKAHLTTVGDPPALQWYTPGEAPVAGCFMDNYLLKPGEPSRKFRSGNGSIHTESDWWISGDKKWELFAHNAMRDGADDSEAPSWEELSEMCANRFLEEIKMPYGPRDKEIRAALKEFIRVQKVCERFVKIGVEIGEDSLRSLIVNYVSAQEEIRLLPEEAYLDPAKMDQLTKALARRDAAYQAMELLKED